MIQTMPVGRYKGRNVGEIPAGYLRWALKEMALTADLRAAIESEVAAHEHRKRLAATWSVWRRPIDGNGWDRVRDVQSEAEGSRLVQQLRDEGSECAFAIVPVNVDPADELPDPPTAFVSRPDGSRRRPASCCIARRNR